MRMTRQIAEVARRGGLSGRPPDRRTRALRPQLDLLVIRHCRWSERIGEQLGLVDLALVVEVAHRGPRVGVAHPRLDLDDARAVDGERAEGVAQVVEAQRT